MSQQKLTLSPLLPFTYTQNNAEVKVLFKLPENDNVQWSLEILDVDIQEDRIIVQIIETEEIILDVKLFAQASIFASTPRIKNNNLQIKIRKQHEGANWSQIFANGFDYTVSQEFPSNMEDFDLNDLQEITQHDITLKPQLPPFSGELTTLESRVLELLTVYENNRRAWLRDNQEALREARDRGLAEMRQSEENTEDDLSEFAKELWQEARAAFERRETEPENFEKAKRAAEYGCTEAQHFVAGAYAADGTFYGVEKDTELANAFFRRAAFQSEHLQSLLQLVAVEEEASKENEEHRTIAKALYLKCAQLGYQTAFFRLGLLLHSEYEQEQNVQLVQEAVEWWKLALRRGHAQSARNIGSTLKDILNERDLALQYYRLGSQWSDQIHIPQDLLEQESGAASDPDQLLDEVLRDVVSSSAATGARSSGAEKLATSQTSNSSSEPADSEDLSPTPRQFTNPLRDRTTTPIADQTNQILGRLSPRMDSPSRMSPMRSDLGKVSHSPARQASRMPRIEDYGSDDESDREDVQMDPPFLWRLATKVIPVVGLTAIGYALVKVLAPAAQHAPQQQRAQLGGPIVAPHISL